MTRTEADLRAELGALRRRAAEIEAQLREPAAPEGTAAAERPSAPRPAIAEVLAAAGVLVFSASPGSEHIDFAVGAVEQLLGPGAGAGGPIVWQEMFCVEDAAALGRAMEVLATTGRAEMEASVRRPDGAVRRCRVLMQVVADAQGLPLRVDGLLVDIEGHAQQAEQAEREVDERFRQFAERIRDVFWSLEVGSQRVLYVSPAFEEIWGRPTSDPIIRGLPALIETVLPEDRDGLTSAIAAALQPHSRGSASEYRITRPDGTIRWLRDRSFPVRDEKGNLVRLVGVAADVTEERRVQRELAASQALLRAALDALPLRVAVLDGAGRIVSANAAWSGFAAEMGCGLRESCVGKSYLTECASVRGSEPARAARAAEGIADVLAGRRVTFETEVPVRVAGAERWFVVRAAPIPASAGEARAIVSHLDVTERRAAEEAERSTAARFQHIVDHGWDLITLADADGRIRYAAGVWKDQLGIAPEDLVGRFGTGLGHPDDEAARAAVRAAVLAEPGSIRTYELRLRHADGHYRWYEVRLVNLLHDPMVQAVVSTGHDIDERKHSEQAMARVNAELEQRVAERTAELRRANDALVHASRAKDEFLAGMSHELRTPLNAVLGLSEALQEDIYGLLGDRQRGPVHRIEESGRHLLSLINDILDLSKIEAGKSALDLGPVDVDELCRASIRMVQEAARKKRLRVSQRLRGGFGAVLADERRLKQIVVNLLSNAVKFTPEGGKIGLDAAVDDAAGTLELCVWDEGIGMTADEIGRLFQPFVQLDAGLDRRHAGTGLGLALVRRLVDLHGGDVGVASTPGEGSRFTVTIPARRPPRPRSAHPIAPRPLGRAVIIDGSLNDAEHLERYLVESGVEPILHADPASAVDRVAIEAPDVVFLDMLADGTGWDVLRRLKDDGRTAAVPVVLASVMDRPEHGLVALAAEYIVKPVDRARLSEALTHLAELRASTPPPATEPSTSRRILLAEDAEANVGTLLDFLSARGYQVVVARDGREAVTMARELRPDLVLMDVQMPVLDGLAAIRELRADPSPEVRHAPIIALTALAMAGDRERVLAAGADDYLTKPVGLRLLGETIEARLAPLSPGRG